MNNNQNNNIEEMINKIINIVGNEIKRYYNRKMSKKDIYITMNDLTNLVNSLTTTDYKKAGQYAITKLIPMINLIIKQENDNEYKAKYLSLLEESYRIGAKIDFGHFLVYYEWDSNDKIYEYRFPILRSYVYYLNKMTFDPTFELIIANLPSGWGKLLADDTDVLTKNGWKKHGELVVGDYVLNNKGEWVKVKYIHSKGIANVKVTFSDGEEFYCHNNHEWYLYDRHTQKNKVIETNELLKNYKEKDGRNRYLIPFNNYVIGEKKELPVDPYTYGVWLGDGTNRQARICSSLKDRIVIDTLPYKISSTQIQKNTGVIYNNYKNLRKGLKKIGLCYWNKTIPKFIHEDYLTANIDQRLQLLAGLLDTDGYLNKKEKKYIFTTSEESLKNTFIELCNTFNWRCSTTIRKPRISTSGIVGKRQIYQISFRPDCFIPCKLERKQLYEYSRKQHISIEKVEYINNPKIGNCITVDGGLYLVGKGLKVTHNSRIAKLYEAFRFGIEPTGTFLSLCSNDTVVKGGSRSVIDIIKSERYGKVFPDLDYSKMKKDLFLKETDGEWKLKYCSMLASYYASTTNSNVVGQRASLSIHIDDLYADYKEALDENLNNYYYNKYVTVWRERFVQSKQPQIIISGTLWSPTDFIKKVIDLTKSESEFIPHPKFKYTLISKDGKKVIIQVPAIDEDTGESSCPDLISTEKLLRKKNSMDTYLWETNFQQKPTSPEGLEFDWNKIKTYDYVPENKYNCSFAVIDGTRKSGKDFFSMPIFQYANEEKTEYLLVDCIFTKTATSELINDILDKIVENRIVTLVIETNVDGGLKKVLEEKFDEYGIDYCTVIEKYNTVTKSIRIEAEKGRIVKYIRFPSREMFGLNSDMGKMMSNLTTYSTLSKNRNDDSPDSMAMFTSEIVGEKAKPRRAVAVKRL